MEGEETPSPKAARPVPEPSGEGGRGFAVRIAVALRGGPLSVTAICEAAKISYPTASRELKARPEWFLKTGASVATQWTLTERGRQAAETAH